jgi:hypothetical protein
MKKFLRARKIIATAAVLASALSGFAQTSQQIGAPGPIAPTGGAASCGSVAFLTLEQGKLAAVDWVDRSTGQIHTRVIETQPHVIDATINLRSDETAAHSSAVLSTAGESE